MLEKMEQLYVVQTNTSSENKVDESEELNDKQRKITYLFEKEKRNLIHRERANVGYVTKSNSVRFYSLVLTNEAGKEQILKAYKETDQAMKEIDPILKAEVNFLPLDLNQIAKGNVYEQILGSIKFQVFNKVFKRVDDLVSKEKDKLPETTKKSLKNLIDQCRALNVVKDQDIENQIDKIAKQIETESLVPLRNSLQEALKTGEGRFYALEV